MANIEQLKSENLQQIRSLFYQQNDPWTRPDLAKASGLSMGGTTNILKVLLEQNEIQYLGDAPSTGGRKSKLYKLNPDYANMGTMLLSHTDELYSISVASIDLAGKIVFHQQKTISDATGFNVLREMVLTLKKQDPLLKCLVVSFPGMVSVEGIARSSDFPGLAGMNIRERLEELLGVPVQIENDVNLAAVGYHHMHPESENLAVLYQPKHDPAGVGIVINGHLYQGGNGLAGEIGRMEKNRQLALLASDPKQLVQLQLDLLRCLLAPDRMGWSCSMLKEIHLPEDGFSVEVEEPVVERIDDLEGLIRLGAEMFGREILLNNYIDK